MKTFHAATSMLLSLAASVVLQPAHASNAGPLDVSRVLEPGKNLDDPRLGRQRTATDKYHPWTPAATKAEWEKQSQAIRERVLVAAGLWPLPPKEPLKPVMHGRIDRGDYTVEKAFFASLPGHYVSGNLYRPTKIKGKVPGAAGIPADERAPLSVVYKAAGPCLTLESQPLTPELVAGRLSKH